MLESVQQGPYPGADGTPAEIELTSTCAPIYDPASRAVAQIVTTTLPPARRFSYTFRLTLGIRQVHLASRATLPFQSRLRGGCQYTYVAQAVIRRSTETERQEPVRTACLLSHRGRRTITCNERMETPSAFVATRWASTGMTYTTPLSLLGSPNDHVQVERHNDSHRSTTRTSERTLIASHDRGQTY